MLAMLRCVNTSPGWQPRIVVSGIRESAHPIQRILGDWPLADSAKKEGFVVPSLEAHSSLKARARAKASGEVSVSGGFVEGSDVVGGVPVAGLAMALLSVYQS